MDDTENTNTEAVSQEAQVNEGVPPTAGADEAEKQDVPPAVEEKAVEPEAKTFTQEEVNGIIQDRIKRVYDKFGASTPEELEKMVGESQSYEVMKDENAKLSDENASLKSQICLMKNGIDEGRYDDVKAIMGASKTDITDESLKSALAKHPEWAKKAGYAHAQIGDVSDGSKHEMSEEDYAKKCFGLDW